MGPIREAVSSREQAEQKAADLAKVRQAQAFLTRPVRYTPYICDVAYRETAEQVKAEIQQMKSDMYRVRGCEMGTTRNSKGYG
jgi:hypothetical protein